MWSAGGEVLRHAPAQLVKPPSRCVVVDALCCAAADLWLNDREISVQFGAT